MGSSVGISWWALAIRGVAGILLGIAAFAWTGITLLVLIALFAAYLLVDGAFAIVAGIRGASWLLRRIVRNEFLLVLGGIVSIVFGILLAINPSAGVVTIVWLFGAYMLIFGVLALALALRLRSSGAARVVGPA